MKKGLHLLKKQSLIINETRTYSSYFNNNLFPMAYILKKSALRDVDIS